MTLCRKMILCADTKEFRKTSAGSQSYLISNMAESTKNLINFKISKFQNFKSINKHLLSLLVHACQLFKPHYHPEPVKHVESCANRSLIKT